MDVEHLYRGAQIDLANAHFYGTSWRSMGEATGLSPTTIKKFANGETSRPSFQTVALLAGYAGYAVSIARKEFPPLRAVK